MCVGVTKLGKLKNHLSVAHRSGSARTTVDYVQSNYTDYLFFDFQTCLVIYIIHMYT